MSSHWHFQFSTNNTGGILVFSFCIGNPFLSSEKSASHYTYLFIWSGFLSVTNLLHPLPAFSCIDVFSLLIPILGWFYVNHLLTPFGWSLCVMPSLLCSGSNDPFQATLPQEVHLHLAQPQITYLNCSHSGQAPPVQPLTPTLSPPPMCR